MGIPERKSREREERRRLILESAKDLILERGVGALSMQDIADATELSKATLYLYFDNKEAILTRILDEAEESFIAYVEARIDPATSGIEALRTLWASYIDLFSESRDIFVLTGIMRDIVPAAPLGAESGGDQAGPSLARMRSLIAGILERGMRDGTLASARDPDSLARTVILVSMAIIDNVARLPREARDTRLIIDEMKGTFELMLHGLAAPGTDRALLGLTTG